MTAELAIIARLEGDASKGLQDIDKRLIGLEKSSGLASKGLAGLQKVGLAAAAGVGVAAAAVTAFAVSSAKDFLQFQDGMNEVFTLLPGITEDAMSAMSDSVLQTAQDIGRMPEEVIPALYQSLSAGVPQDNVFSFLEQAHMAALGGVTDLETAVDGITSVINAYGTDVIGAGEASDLMFTAVRLGKTTFGELAGSLSKVTPLASAMGIGFEDITAAMATMTSQGTPTAVATTQLSRLFQELGTAGTEVSDVFEEVAGESFLDFIEGGGNVADALKLVQEGADAAGMPMQDMFGSIQAGMAALQLSGKGMESFESNLEAMENSAGATQAAYDTMNAGVARSLEVIQAKFASFKIGVGAALGPLISMAAEKVTVLADALLQNLGPVIDTVGEVARQFFSALDEGMSPLDAFTEAIWEFVPKETYDRIVEIRNKIAEFIESVKELGQSISDFVQPIQEFVSEFVSMQDVLTVVGVLIGGFIINVLLGLAAAVAPVVLVFAGLVALVSVIRNVWESDFLGIRTAVENFVAKVGEGFSTVQGIVEGLGGVGATLDTFKKALSELVALFTGIGADTFDTLDNVRELGLAFGLSQEQIGKFEEVLLTVSKALNFGGTIDRIKDSFSGLGDSVSPIGGKLSVLKTALAGLLTALKPIGIFIGGVLLVAFKLFGEIIAQVMSRAGSIIGTVVDYISGQISALTTIISGIVQFVQGVFSGNWEQAWGGLSQVVEGVVAGIQNTLATAISLVDNFVGIIWDSIANLIGDLTGKAIPSWDEFKASVVTAWEGIVTAVETAVASVKQWFADLETSITTWVTNVGVSWEEFKATVIGVWDSIGVSIQEKVDAVKAAWDGLVSSGDTVKEGVTGIGESFSAFFTTIASFSLKDTLSGWLNAIKTWASGVVGSVAEAAAGIIKSFVGALLAAPGKIKDTLAGWWESFTTWFGDIDWYQLGYDIVFTILTGLKFFAVDAPKIMSDWIVTITKTLEGYAKELVASGVELVTQIVEGLKDFATQAVTEVSTWPEKISDWILETATAVYDAGVELVTQIVDGLIEFATKAAAEVSSWPGRIADWIYETVTALYDAGVELVTQIVEGLKDFATKAVAEVSSWPKRIADWIFEKQLELFNAGVELVTQIVEGLKDFAATAAAEVSSWPGAIANKIGEMVETIGLIGSAIATHVVTGLAAFAEKAGTAVTTWITNLSTAVGNTLATIIQVGADIIEGVITGVTDAGSKLITAILDVAQGAYQAVKDFFGIESPSKLMAQLGAWLMEGLALGIDENGDVVGAAIIIAGKEIELAFLEEIAEAVIHIASAVAPAISALHMIANLTLDSGSAFVQKMLKFTDMLYWLGRVFAAAGWKLVWQNRQQAEKMAPVIEAVSNAVIQAVAALTLLGEVTFPTDLAPKMIALQDFIYNLALAVAQISISLGEDLSLEIKAMAEAALSVLALIAPAIDAMTTLSKVDFGPIVQGMRLADQIRIIRNIIRTTMRLFVEASFELTGDMSDAVKSFADAAQSVFALIEIAVVGATILSEADFGQIVQGMRLSNQLRTFRNIVRSAMRLFVEVAEEIDGEMSAAVSDFIAAAADVFALIEDAIAGATLLSTADFGEIVQGTHLADQIQIFADIIQLMVEAFARAVENTKDLLVTVADLIPIVDAIVAVIETAVEAIAAMGESVKLDVTQAQIDAFISDFQYLVQWMILAFDVIDEYMRDMLVEAQDLVPLVNEILDAVATAVDALGAMGEIVGIEITSAQIDRFISAFQYLVQWMILAFDLIENDFRDMLVESADLVLLVNEILDVVVTAVEAIASVSEYVPLEDATEKITAMKDDMIILAEAMVLALEELAKGLKDAIPVAGEVAGDVGDILDVVTPAIEALAGIADYVSLADAQSKIDSFKDDLLLVADALIEALSDLAGRLEESLAAAALVAGSVVSVLEVIGPAIDGLIALGDYKGIANLRTKLGTFTFQFEEAVFDLAFSLDVLNQRLGEKIATAATVAEAATGIFDGVQTAVDALNSLAELKTSSVKKQMDYLVAQSQMIVDALTNPAPIGSDVVQAASDFAANIAALVVAVQDALDSINELVNSNVDGSLQGILDDLVELMAETAVPAGQAGAAIGDAFGQGLLNALSSLVSGVLAAVQGIVAALGSGNSGAYAAGQNLGNSFASGLYSRLSLVAAAARALASQAEASIRTELQIFSPSKVATRLAESFVEGFEAPFLTPLSFATAFSPFTAAATVGTGYAQSQQNISGDTIYLDIKLENGGPVAPQTVEQLTNIIQNVIDKNGRDAYIQRRTLR